MTAPIVANGGARLHDLKPRKGFTTKDRQEIEVGDTHVIRRTGQKRAVYLLRAIYMRWGEEIEVLDAAEAAELAAVLRRDRAPLDERFDDLAVTLDLLSAELEAARFGGIV